MQFSATVSGYSNTSVTWNLNPAIGTLSNTGLYTAPSSIVSAQRITVTVTTVATPQISATAIVTLSPPVTVTVTPGSATLFAGQTQQLKAKVSNAANTGVTWVLNPAVGTISRTGLYTAPAGIATGQMVVAIATSVVDSTKSAFCLFTLVASPLSLPVEVMGPANTNVSAQLNVPSLPSGTIQLSMRIHGLRYNTEASVQVNQMAMTPINSSTVTILGNGAAYGGIGGGFSTLDMTMSLPSNTLVAGLNTITFQFNGTDGRTSGFRVLALNFLDSNGNQLVPSSVFTNTDPNTWVPPLNDPSDISAGQSLWYSAQLTAPTANGPVVIQAHCTSCHAQDGRDLKYFNYSNLSIHTRAVFHGLTDQQGDQIASYIRSLSVPNPGRPWNPPYQPGPGLDSQPVANWAAGAGLSAVLANDSGMAAYLTPSGSTAGWAANQYISARNMPIALQLADWNSWLPAIHPMDAFGTAFTSSTFNTLYPTVRSLLVPNNPTAYQSTLGTLTNWFIAANQVFIPSVETSNWDAVSGPLGTTARTNVYSAALWQMVKLWEINQEFGLEGMASVPFGSKAESRAWYSQQPFFTSPNMMHMTSGAGLGNGSGIAQIYLSFIWYQTQLILNDGNGTQTGGTPIDYGYVFGFIKNLNWYATPAYATPESYLLLFWMVKGLQEETEHGVDPSQGGSGWAFSFSNPETLIDSAWQYTWSATPASTKAALMQAYLQAWYPIASSFTPQQYYLGGWASASQQPAGMSPVTMGGALWSMLPMFRYYGVDPNLTYTISAWAATIFPLGNWSFNNSLVCNANYQCATN